MPNETQKAADLFKSTDTAPRDGTFVRLRFRPGILMPADFEVVGHWQHHAEMKAGGAWFDRVGHYITPGPITWAPEQGSIQ